MSLKLPFLDAPCEPAVPLVEELSPAPEPWEAFQRIAALPHPLFLDSALNDPSLGRYSFLTADPFEWLCARGQRTLGSGETQSREPADPFSVLAERLTLHSS